MIKYNKTNEAFKFTLNKESFLQSTFQFTDIGFRLMLHYQYSWRPRVNNKNQVSMIDLLNSVMSDEDCIIDAEYTYEAPEDIDELVERAANKKQKDKDYTKEFADLQELLTEIKVVMYEAVKDKVDSGDAIDFSTFSVYITNTERRGDVFIAKENGLMIGFKITNAQHKVTMFGEYVDITGSVYTAVEDGISKGQFSKVVPSYKGEKTFKEIGFIEQTDEVTEELITRAKLYVELNSKPSYVNYSGNLVRRSWWGDSNFRSDGRIMVDYKTMKKIDPNYADYFGENRWADKEDALPFDTEFSSEHYVLMPPYAYGFSFVSKQWGEIVLEKTSPIEFRDQAYDQLVLESTKKDMIRALVESNDTGKDIIAGKGGGLIFLLDGTPGVGKTLTAEAVAEKLHKPLYIVGAGELGVNPQQLEANLRNILDTAHFWDAVLLIDEADIFLEARSTSDILRNAMVGIFLRMLEYYQGILFLTTNRADSIDDAFFSRISLSMHYHDLDAEKRVQIWTNVLELYEATLDPKQLASLGEHVINGRQIKNCVRLAHSLATSKEKPLDFDDIQQVVGTIQEFKDAVSKTKPGKLVKQAVGFLSGASEDGVGC
jgi:hypothetical protein